MLLRLVVSAKPEGDGAGWSFFFAASLVNANVIFQKSTVNSIHAFSAFFAGF
jgi:hypothetical protein